MRARSSVQRFPVAQWIKDLETLQSTSIEMHQRVARRPRMSLSIPGTGFSTPSLWPSTPTAVSTANSSRAPSPDRRRITRMSRYPETEPPTPGGSSGMPSLPVTALSTAAPSRAHSPERRPHTSGRSSGNATPVTNRPAYRQGSLSNLLGSRLMALTEIEKRSGSMNGIVEDRRDNEADTLRGDNTDSSRDSNGSSEIPNTERLQEILAHENLSTLTLDTVAAGRKDFKLQNVDPFFNDPSGRYFERFEKHLDQHIENLSSDKLCVEDYLKKSEKDWFGKFYNAKLGKAPGKNSSENSTDEFQLGHDHVAPKLLRKWLQRKVGDWPIYTFLLALGQIIAANSCKCQFEFYKVMLADVFSCRSNYSPNGSKRPDRGTTLRCFLHFPRRHHLLVVPLSLHQILYLTVCSFPLLRRGILPSGNDTIYRHYCGHHLGTERGFWPVCFCISKRLYVLHPQLWY